jgi:hypothetical protein
MEEGATVAHPKKTCSYLVVVASMEDWDGLAFKATLNLSLNAAALLKERGFHNKKNLKKISTLDEVEWPIVTRMCVFSEILRFV